MKNMKSFFALILLSIIVSILWITAGYWEINKENYISKKVLELSVPFNVRINTEFLKSLESTQGVLNNSQKVDESANESSRTSPEGI